MPPEPFVQYDFWQLDPPDLIDVSCLMPNGIIIIMKVSQNATFEEIKEELWENAQRFPLYGRLHDKSEYVITVISGSFGKKGKAEEIHNEAIRLCDVQPYFCLLKIVEKDKSTDNPLEKDISHLIGKPVEEFKNLNNPEVNDFRYKMGVIADEMSEERKRMTWQQRLMYQYPPRLAKNINIPQSVRGRFNNEKFMIVSRSENDANSSFTHEVPYHLSPTLILKKILMKMSHTSNKPQHNYDDYILKICGQDEYIFGENQIIQFLHVQDVLSANGIPSFVIQAKQNVNMFKKSIYETTLSKLEDRKNNDSKARLGMSTCTLKKKLKYTSSWDIKQQLQICIHAIKGLNCDTNKAVEVGIRAGLFHGGKSLCEPQKTVPITLPTDGCPKWEEVLKFDIMVYNVPRMARLCLVVYEIVKNSKGSSSSGGTTKRRPKDKLFSTNPIAWVNTTVFDYKHQLKTGAMTLYTWTYAEDSQSEDWLHPLGTVESNPRTDERAAIMLSIYNYNIDNVIVYPPEDRILTYAEELEKTKNFNRDSAQDCRSINQIMSPYLNNDKIQEMHDQDRNAIWAKRNDVQEFLPQGLPCLLHCVEWNDRDEVSEMRRLLTKWKPLSEERALELLDYAYACSSVRSFAVKCLKMLNLTDDELLLYLLQLVQAMKHESYFQCDLVEFLLDRALQNHRIGHHFFWHLRSEMLVPSVQVRFGIILEAYLKGSQEHIQILLKQISCLDELKKVSEQAKKVNKDKGRAVLQQHLNNSFIKQKIEDVLSPLNPSFRCRSIKIDKCKVMDSKMRPLWIVFENSDMHGDDICVIFKNGDDLRQDMLTLQMLRVMDKIWKSHGYDFRMNPYTCVSTEHRLGMIEIVSNAETIANIQKERGMFSATSPFKKGSLYAWLKDHNPDDLDKAIREFTLSCAGYCVATYVLGVADRHSDNIMVKKTGQLFHIDFGHILGHFKEKFGIRRERVPFVLTHDFVYIINKGKTDRETEEFKTFKQLCETAFLLLRSHGCLILSLFSMMISTGLPELSSEKDLNYLRDTLVLDMSEEEARDHFRQKFSEALLNSWKTSLNWASHNFSKNNKQ
ncbi:phosphatidylinositol 4,5-bisphosphate 3-kinase catalytic subunit beta isoform [Sitodiplosis mosellana]|uniref:phosphatidylinositol 4,5-bisphosphate 3-kinase catalytic subunit beta isoform n=1 Tax=Sitodiplosis mosellana TaxID=263140 RepID=UPI0024440789|nr:phosphatidylinositol 4,5-bisphosphate 3-kinase catalytic subunit beta isoform [Sitodiplosis mosellana]XP_055310434.1 phosphatidylinositol 4,5-bisphosphate 3-kinase catalytic subunit beta isoform [Sitodiplosis mosellana]